MISVSTQDRSHQFLLERQQRGGLPSQCCPLQLRRLHWGDGLRPQPLHPRIHPGPRQTLGLPGEDGEKISPLPSTVIFASAHRRPL